MKHQEIVLLSPLGDTVSQQSLGTLLADFLMRF